MYAFSNDWFTTSELKRSLDKHLRKDIKLDLLEIGVYEGACSCFLSDYYLDHDFSTLICVDPFDTTDTTAPVYTDTKARFIDNIILSKNCNKVKLVQEYSDIFFENNTKVYDFIYIDGSHLEEDLELDLINALKFCKTDGIIWVDDYLWTNADNVLKTVIDKFHDINKDRLETIHSGYQIAFRKLY